jgi:FMN phosphatase YigB (HAD superfamily)
MNAVRAVLLDVRGTLLDVTSGWQLTDDQRIRFPRTFDAERRDVELRAALGEAVAAVNEIAGRGRRFFDQDRLVLERAAAKVGLEIPPERIDEFEEWRNRLFVRAVEAYPDAAMTLLGLRIAGVDLLDVVVASEESGEVKATGAALRLACTRAGIDPSDVVFVGDRLDRDVTMARAAGAQAVLLVRSGGLDTPAGSITSLTEFVNWRFETRKETATWSTSTTSS